VQHKLGIRAKNAEEKVTSHAIAERTPVPTGPGEGTLARFENKMSMRHKD
jgi:hypothetical protein